MTIVWFHDDLRLCDHPALTQAAADGPVLPVFIWSPEEHGAWPPGAARRWWLHHSLRRLDEALRGKGLRLILRRGPAAETLRALLDETGATAVYWTARYEPALRRRDERLAKSLKREGITVARFGGRLLHDPDAVRTNAGDPYRVFTPFWKKMKATVEVSAPLPVPDLTPDHTPATWPETLPVDALGLLPEIDWAGGLREAWTPGEDGARARLEAFLDDTLAAYPEGRDRPDRPGTSRLSPHLAHGEISPRQVWHAVRNRIAETGEQDAGEAFLRELGWREFGYHLLHHFPHTTDRPLQEKFDAFPWRDDDDALHRWQRGRTGFPIVDAGMRQLWHTGWMHNRVRMIVASFLTKDLLIPWQEGARWFWDTLVDADLANNTLGWQWSAGSGADAQPFFRIFNPVAQGRRHDPDGAYVRRWVPELKDVQDRALHAPWEAGAAVLAKAGVRLGETYPAPMVNHAEARQRALDAYERVK
ncbi:DNA photolyase family protein [Rhodocaloribacter litoris]|uniref:cryptochrome/photolyase family protein n=1 Tax=Rhodocaloribacter litoris TaxID=2558931 RepID=UPI00141FC898|nr:deoxyribodipyrimidine photo-lyase [Rhodocaloribacter litoris]QXD14500.1 DNA photolyase family protein [Rhodocaloribacter litoris]